MMRIAFVSIPRFACAVEMQRRPLLALQPLIVGDAEQPKRVLDCSFSASMRQIRHGMTIRQAVSYCPEAIILPPDPVLYRNTWRAVLAAINDITPEVEDQEMGAAYLSAQGLQRHYREEEDLCSQIRNAIKGSSGLEVSIGLATGKFPAFAAAATARAGGETLVPAGKEKEFLAPLTSALLPCDQDIHFRMHLLGLEQLGDLAALSVAELQSQFGPQGKRLWELANGIDGEPLRNQSPSEPVETTIRLDAPVAGIEVMLALARQLLSRLKPLLNGRSVRELRLQAELTSGRSWENHIVFKEPLSEDARLEFLLRSSLNTSPPPQAIVSLSLRLENMSAESGKQLSLDRKSRKKQHLEETIRQLKARYGHSPIYRCVDVSPWSVIPEERQILVESDV